MLSIPGFENVPALRFVIAFAIIFVLLALFALILRRLKGSRLTLASDRGRARQPRLGIVDVYDLDRQRQLILLRRDNVEHLLLVGGPNDVVVETSIVRMPGTRLPASPAEFADPAPERNGDAGPSRPVIEPSAGRQPDAAIPIGETEAAPALPTRGPVAVRAVASQTRPAPADLRPERPRATPTTAPTAMPGRPLPAKPAAPQPSPAPRNGEAAESPRAAEGDRAVLSGMARELEDVLKRTPEPRPKPDVTRMPSAPLPSRLESRSGAGVLPGGGRVRPDIAPRPQPGANPDQDPATASPPPGGSATSAVIALPAPITDEATADHAAGDAGPPSMPAAMPPAPTPPPSEPVTASPAVAPPSMPERPRPPEAAASEPSPRSDPFSIEDIEAEFARLLGRPLDRKDKI